jgi:hypothetical protein
MGTKKNYTRTIIKEFKFKDLKFTLLSLSVSIVLKLVIIFKNSNENTVSIGSTGISSQVLINQENHQQNNPSILEILFYIFVAMTVLGLFRNLYKILTSQGDE